MSVELYIADPPPAGLTFGPPTPDLPPGVLAIVATAPVRAGSADPLRAHPATATVTARPAVAQVAAAPPTVEIRSTA